MMKCLFVFFPRLTMYDVWQWLSWTQACIIQGKQWYMTFITLA